MIIFRESLGSRRQNPAYRLASRLFSIRGRNVECGQKKIRVNLSVNQTRRKLSMLYQQFASFSDCKYRPRREHMSNRKLYKDQQLCHQVAHALTYCLGDGDPKEIMECLRVEAVSPAPDASRLMVTLSFDSGDPAIEYDAVLTAIENNNSRLRFEISQEINRKKTPQLAFCLIPFA